MSQKKKKKKPNLKFSIILWILVCRNKVITWFLSVKFERSETSGYEVMKEEIRKVVSKGKAAAVLRLVFHDAGTFHLDDHSGQLTIHTLCFFFFFFFF